MLPLKLITTNRVSSKATHLDYLPGIAMFEVGKLNEMHYQDATPRRNISIKPKLF